MPSIPPSTLADLEVAPLGPAWRTAFGAALGLTIGPSVLLIMTFGVSLPAIRADFGWSVAQGAIGSAIISFVLMLSAPIQGLLCDRLGARRMILASALPFGAGMIALSAMPGNPLIFYAACALLPLLGLGLWPVAYNKVVAGWFDRRLGLAMGVVAAGIGIGATAVPPIAVHLIETYGWRTSFQTLGVVSATVAIFTATLMLRDPPTDAVVKHDVAGDRFAEAVRRPVYQKLLLGFLLLGFVASGVLVHQTMLLVETGYSLQEAGLLQGMLGAAIVVGRLGVGWLLDRLPVSVLLPPILLAASLGCLAFAFGSNGIIIPLSVAAIGLMIGAELDVLGYVIRRSHGRRAFGVLYGLGFTAFTLGGTLGAVGVGELHARYGGYTAPYVLLAALALISAAIFAMPSFGRGAGPREAQGVSG